MIEPTRTSHVPTMATGMRSKLHLSLAAMLTAACGDDNTSVATTDGSTTTGVASSDSSVFTSAVDTFPSDEVTGNPTTVGTSVTSSELTTDEPTTNATSGVVSSSEGSVTGDVSTGSSSNGPGTTTDATSSSGPSETTDVTSTSGATTTDATGSTTDASTGTTDASTGGGGFPDAPPFGSNILDLDLVGSWNLNWDPATGFDSVLDIDDVGNFVWTETSADCSQSTVAAGYLWVEGAQVVMHVEQWDRQLPWDTEAVLGEAFPPPFRLRLSFSLQGNSGTAYLALGAPARVVETTPYLGVSYLRLTQAGSYLGGTWHGEAELHAIPAGETDPVVIVRDTYEAVLDAEPGVDPESTGVRSINTQYFPLPESSWTYGGGNWTCLNGCPAVAGTTLVDGSNLFTYGPYGGHTHLMPFQSGRAFRRDVPSDCP